MPDGTLVEPGAERECIICGSRDCKQFHEAPYPAHYPFLPGGYDPDATADVEPIEAKGKRKGRGLRCS